MGTRPAGSVFGENSSYRETRGTRRGGRHVAKRSSDPRVAYSEVNAQVRDLVRVVGIVAPFAPQGFSILTSKLEAWNMIRSSMRSYHTYPLHRAPIGALCEGSSMRTCRYAQSSDRSYMRRELCAALQSFHLRTSLWFYQTSHSGTFCFTPGWMKKRVPDYLRFVFWNEMIKLRRQFVQNDDARKTILFQNLQRLLSCTLMSTEKPRFCHFEERNGINVSFFVNVNAYSYISLSKPASFDTISTKISQFCSFAKHC